MTQEDDTGREEQDGDRVPVEQEQVLELNFVPNWARRPPGAGRSGEHESDATDAGRERGSGRPRRDRPTGAGDRGRRGSGRETPGRGPGRSDRRTDERSRSSDSRPDRRTGRPQGGPADRREAVQVPPVDVRFVPEKAHLSGLVRKLHIAKRACSLVDLAWRFLAEPTYCRVIIERARGATSDPELWQCKACGMVGQDAGSVRAHAVRAHLEDYFEKEETTGEAPAGQFVCVARCGLSGILLGPPNHHCYAERLEDLHRTRFAHMPLDEYSRRIETVRDPELVEQWKEESRKKTLYRAKGAAGEGAEPMDRAEAERLFWKDSAPNLVRKTRRASLSADVARRIDDPGLREAVRLAQQREQHFPSSLAFAVHQALRHMGIHSFKAGKAVTYVTAIQPVPLRPDHAVDSIAEVLAYLQEHPGCKRAELVKDLWPELAPDSPELAKALAPLGWLIDKGYIIEFADGALAVPLASRAAKPGSPPPGRPRPKRRRPGPPSKPPGRQSKT